MNKTEFCKILKNVENASRLEDDLSKTIIKFNYKTKTEVSWYGFGTLLADDVLELIAEIIGDPGDDLSYFCWELDFGKKWKPGTITDKDGNDIDFSDAGKLYDYLTRKK